jgi:FMN phosphatase YigB (HAD superfamily)
MATIIFDFDDTLFKTHNLKKTIFAKMESLGIPSEIIINTYEISKKKFNHYTPNNHIRVINEMGFFNIGEKQKREINDIDFSLHGVNEVYNTLLVLSKKHHLILLTIGDKDFQKLKIHKSGLHPFFHEIHIIDDKKEDFISSQNFIDDIYFINDKESENKKIRKMFPNIKVIDFDINKRSLERLLLDIL